MPVLPPPHDVGPPAAAARKGRKPLLVSASEIREIHRAIRRDLSEEAAIEAIAALNDVRIAAE